MTLEIKIILAIIFAVMCGLGVHYVQGLQEKAALADQRGSTLQATAGVLTASDAGDQQRQQADTGLAQARDTAHQQLDKVTNENPDLRMRADRVFPDSLRDIARQRRRARERLGRTGDGGQGQAASANAAQR